MRSEKLAWFWEEGVRGFKKAEEGKEGKEGKEGEEGKSKEVEEGKEGLKEGLGELDFFPPSLVLFRLLLPSLVLYCLLLPSAAFYCLLIPFSGRGVKRDSEGRRRQKRAREGLGIFVGKNPLNSSVAFCCLLESSDALYCLLIPSFLSNE